MTTITLGGVGGNTRRRRRGDSLFTGATLVCGALVLGILVAITVFLVAKAVPGIAHDKGNFLTEHQWGRNRYGIIALVTGTLLSSALALVMAVPVALGVSLYITEYAPRRVGTVLGYATDMLAAVPSVVYGLWGLYFLVPHMTGLQRFLAVHLGWFPLFSDPGGQTAVVSRSILIASVILAIMILPIIAAISREVLRQVDPAQREAALALGATRWEVIRVAVLPPSRSGIVGAVMLGLGRALGETIAVALVISSTFTPTWHVLTREGNTIAANIANKFGEANGLGREALIASGLVLFAITLVVNLGARYVIHRSGKEERSSAV